MIRDHTLQILGIEQRSKSGSVEAFAKILVVAITSLECWCPELFSFFAPSWSILQTVGPHPFPCHDRKTSWRLSAISFYSHAHVTETSRANHCRASCGQHRIPQLVRMYLCIVGGICLLLDVHVHIHRPLPHERRWGREECTLYLLFHLNSLYREVCAEMSFSLCNPCHDGRNRFNLVIESRDEILLKGGRLWRPRFLISVINANDRISWVKSADIDQTMVNLGPHLENLTNKP
jgi:hypothetical protein